MARTKETRANAAPGAGTIFALRAIGLVLLARWLFSMSEMDLTSSLSAMASSPWACINLVFLFLLIFLPGARAVAERPFHPLPQWLRQALRLFAFLGFLFAVWTVSAFAVSAGWRRAAQTVAATNGWLLAAPALYAAVLWICRPRALWRTNIAARRFAIGRYAVSLDPLTRTVSVWAERRKVGQYDARELSVRWADGAGTGSASPPAPMVALHAAAETFSTAASTRSGGGPSLVRAAFGRRPKIELLWDSPAAAGHNRQTVFRTALTTEGDRVAARALDSTLRQV
uniref:Transmembrane protein n=1 Tax=Burkholderia sp. (strain CCGE1003) TaxID=640512 RepID=E1T540_BURSG